MEDVKSERRSSIVRAQRRKTTNPNRMAAKRLQFGLSDHDASSSSPPSSGSSSEEDAAGAEKHGEDQEEAEALECRKLNPTSAEEEEEVINTCSAMEQQPQESTLPKPVLQFCRREPSSGSAHTSAVIETPRILKRALPKFGHWDEPHSKIGARNSFVGHDFEIPETPLPRRGSGAVSHFHQAKVVEGVEKMEIAPRVELFSAPACLPVPRRPVSAAARVPPLHGFDSSPEMCRAPDDDLKSHREKRIRAAQERRRRSAPGGGASSPTTSTPGMYRRNIEAVRVSMKENRVANINPFTPRLSLSDISANLSGSLEGSGDKRSAVAAAPHAVLVGTKSFQEEEERQASGW